MAITPIYGAKGYEDRFIPLLSPKYLEMLVHVGAEAKRLGLGVRMATGTGCHRPRTPPELQFVEGCPLVPRTPQGRVLTVKGYAAVGLKSAIGGEQVSSLL